MARIEKTVFICYRRTTVPWALAISQYLSSHGFDVFFDYASLDSGDFETVVLENIRARAHFLVLLTPSSLFRCGEPGDWFRREIEVAIDSQRNIVPLMLEGFAFETPYAASQLTGKLGFLRRYNGVHVPADYFYEALEKLLSKFLSVPLDAVLVPASIAASKTAPELTKLAKDVQRVSEGRLTPPVPRGRKATSSERTVQLSSCFISYSTKDQGFADRLYKDLTSKGVHCWFAGHDMKGGKKIKDQIFDEIQLRDRMLLILSDFSIRSTWVETEIAKARKRELQEKRKILFPIRLVDFERLQKWECFDSETGTDTAAEIRSYFIPDFSNWNHRDAYQRAIDGLLRDLAQNE